jgi:hypothetical protein
MDLIVQVRGRPAPEGSHEIGQHGYVMHSSKYLESWRAAVKRATYEMYRAGGYEGDDLPLIAYPAGCWVSVVHVVTDEQCRAEGTDLPTGKPDGDKLLRATIDGLGDARVFGDDSQVLGHRAIKWRADELSEPGAWINVTDVRPWWADEQTREIEVTEFNPSGEYRLVLERVGTDSDGDRTWETMFETTDTASAVADTWLPAVHTRLSREGASAAAAAPADKPKTGRPRKAAAAPAEVPAAPPAAPEVPVAAPVTVTTSFEGARPVPPAAVADAPARVNPFAH